MDIDDDSKPCRRVKSERVETEHKDAVPGDAIRFSFIADMRSNVDGEANSDDDQITSVEKNDPKEEEILWRANFEELEESEIDADADSEAVAESVVAVSDSDQLGVRDVLQGVTIANVAGSFAQTSSRLLDTLPEAPRQRREGPRSNER